MAKSIYNSHKYELGDIVQFDDRVFVIIGRELNHGVWQYELSPYAEEMLEFVFEDKLKEVD
jgi:hypothetical protein